MLAKHVMEDDQRKDSDKKGATYNINWLDWLDACHA